MNIPILVISTQSSGTAPWTPNAIRTSQIDATNPTYPRIFRMDNQFVTLSRLGTVVGISLESLAEAFVQIAPTLTWPPWIQTQPTNKFPSPTGPCSFSVVVNSELTVTYQWQVSANQGSSWSNVSNGGVYSGATTATLTIASASGLNGYFYRCNMTNASGSTTTNVVGISIDPWITTQPHDQSVSVGANVTFSVVATGQTALNYQWEISTDGGTTWSNLSNAGVYSGVTTANLSISSSAGLNTYKYRVLVSDNNSSITSSAATLTVT